MKIIQIAIRILGFAFVAYVSFFITWLALIGACEMQGNEACGDNTMTYAVRIMYSPIIEILK